MKTNESQEKAKIEDDQNKVSRIREVLAQRKAEKYIKETLVAWKVSCLKYLQYT